MAGKKIILINGMDPTRGTGGGSSYARAHALAAIAAGFEPHIFCLSDRTDQVEAGFGCVHRVETPFRNRGLLKINPQRPHAFLSNWVGSLAFTGHLIPFNLARLSDAIVDFLGDEPGPHLIHGFHNWGCVGLEVRRRLVESGIEVRVINSFFTTALHEATLKLAGGIKAGAFKHWILLAVEWLWIRTVSTAFERRAYRNCRLILANYDSVRRMFRDAHGDVAEMRKITYASELAMTGGREPAPAQPPELGLGSGTPLIVSVSRHDPRKGLDVLIRALALIKARGVVFRACLVSGGTMLAAHRLLVESLGLGNILFTGWVADVRPYLDAAGIFVLPSIQEGSGSVALLEAMQQGLAIVASGIDGIPEDVVDGESALLVPAGDPERLGAAIERLIRDPELRQRLGAGARRAYLDKHSPEAFVRDLESVYRSVLAD